jgi:hypothetical protein
MTSVHVAMDAPSSFYSSTACNVPQRGTFVVVPLHEPEILARARSVALCP